MCRPATLHRRRHGATDALFENAALFGSKALISHHVTVSEILAEFGTDALRVSSLDHRLLLLVPTTTAYQLLRPETKAV